MHGKYCANCGQKVILAEDKKLRHLVTEFFHHFTHLDSKFLSTLKKILFRPGDVTRDISEGITVPHFKLSALFLIGTIIYYLLPLNMVISTPLNESFEQQVTASEYHEWMAKFAKNKSLSGNKTMAELQETYDRRQHDYGKLLTLLFIPLLIPILWALSKLVKKFNPDNSLTTYDLGVASLEINSIILYGFYILAGIIIWLVNLVFATTYVALGGAIIFFATVLLQLFFFFKRAYEISWWQALICLTTTVILYIYILSLFSLLTFLLFI